MRSFLVIGGGMVGAAAALRLQKAGFAVTLIDPGDTRRAASFGNIGCIAAEQVEPWSSRAYLFSFPQRLFAFGGALDFRWRDLGLWLPWSLRFIAATDPARFERGRAALTNLLHRALDAWLQLAALIESPALVEAKGHSVVWMHAARAKAGIAAWRATPTGSTRIRELTPEELGQYESVLRTRPRAGIHFTGAGKVSEPQAVRDALLAAFARHGGKNVAATVRSLRGNGSKAIATTDNGDHEADAALVAAGAWSGRLMRTLGVTAPVIAERGYSVQSAAHAWPETLPATVFEERSMVVNRFTSGLRASSFLEFGHPDAGADARKWAVLQRNLREIGVAFSETPDRWVGPRPTLPDYLPAIGRLERAPRVFYAFGHQHLGVTMAAITAELIEALALEKTPSIALAPFRIERFR